MLYLTVSPNTSRESEENIEYYHCVLWVIETSELGDECAKKQNMYSSQVKMTIERSTLSSYGIRSSASTTHPSRGYRFELGTVLVHVTSQPFLEINTA
jgi:hypothetical protein